MLTIRGCQVSTDLVESWADRLVFDPEPVYVSEAVRPLLPEGAMVSPRREVSRSLDFADAYRTYHVMRAVDAVALLTSAQLRSLSADRRRDLMQQQWRLGRAQTYTREWVAGVAPDAVGLFDWFAADEGAPRAALHADTWRALTRAVRERWLAAFVAEQGGPALPESAWGHLASDNSAVRQLAATFPPASGPNCFATALAAATPDPEAAQAIAGLWLTQEPFLDGLAERDLRPSPWDGPSAVPPGAVVVWAGADGLPQHAAYALGEGFCLHKDSQSWWSPRQVVRLQSVVDAWAEDQLALTVYSPSA